MSGEVRQHEGSNAALRKELCLFKNGQSSRSTIRPGVSLKQHFCPSQELGSVWLQRSRRKHRVCRTQEVMLSPPRAAQPFLSAQCNPGAHLAWSSKSLKSCSLISRSSTGTRQNQAAQYHYCRTAVYLLQEPSTTMSVAWRYPSPMGHHQGCRNEAILAAHQPAVERRGSFQAWSQMEE